MTKKQDITKKEKQDKVIKEWLEFDRKLAIEESRIKDQRVQLFYRMKDVWDNFENDI